MNANRVLIVALIAVAAVLIWRQLQPCDCQGGAE